jgi:toxin HigB-1
MIVSFGDARTERLYHGERLKGFPEGVQAVAWRKLDMLNRAHTLEDMRVPPANRLEPLKGYLKGFFSIRVNDQWRVMFRWREGNAEAVRIVDYH